MTDSLVTHGAHILIPNSIPIIAPIYRFQFSPQFIENLYKFSKIHQYDDRKEFKHAWEQWIEEEEDQVMEEVRRLDSLGYQGDILDKMFKSARYYFRKKSTSKKAPKARRDYISCRKCLLDAMDHHIWSGLQNQDQIQNQLFKPSEGFQEFCHKNTELLKSEIRYLIQQNIVQTEEIQEKIKKTYKNRYFTIISNHDNNRNN